MNYEISTLILIVFHLVVSFSLVYMAYRLIKWVLNRLWIPIEATKNTTLNLFISLGVTMFFFQDFVKEIVGLFVKFITFPFYTLKEIVPDKTVVTDATGKETYQDIGWGNIIDKVMNWIEKIGNEIWFFLKDMNYPKFIILLTIWLLFAKMFNEIGKLIRRHEKAINLQDTQDENYSQNPVVRTMLTLSFLLFSIYLSISAIVAVGEFEPKGDVNYQVLVEDLNKSLNNISYYKKDELKLAPIPINYVTPDVEELKTAINELNNIIVDFNTTVESQVKSDSSQQRTILDRFNAAIQTKMSLADRNKYKFELLDWYSQRNSAWVNKLASQKQFYSEKAIFLKNLANDTTLLFNDTITTNPLKIRKRYGEDLNSKLDNLNVQLTFLGRDLSYNLTTIDNFQIPEKPRKGENFGPFKPIAGWLLNTESTSLALIVGMFGFGLLGSIGSTFIRKRLIAAGTEISEAIIVNDLLGIVINGISASIVIFLSVKGAVLVFTAGNSEDLNAYVLFFTCLIASVFSENVWQWAKTKLSQNLGEKSEKQLEQLGKQPTIITPPFPKNK